MVLNNALRRLLAVGAAVCFLVLPVPGVLAQPIDPLPSWADGEVKQAIKQFVVDVTAEGGHSYVPREKRIAVFDNDGTLWSERPWVQGLFIEHLLRKAAASNPSLADEQPYKAAIENDREFFEKGGMRDYQVAIRRTMTELSRKDFDAEVRAFFATARHPILDVPFQQTVYQPALELLEYLRANGFKTYICSGGGVDFMRAMSGDFYGIETDQVIGTSYKKELHEVDGRWELTSTAELNTFNNRDQKAVNIDLHIGQRPLLVMGNAGGKGDIGMLGYSQGREGRSLQLIIDHDDEAREFAYAEDDNESLNVAKENGWHIISMKEDWSAIYPTGSK